MKSPCVRRGVLGTSPRTQAGLKFKCLLGTSPRTQAGFKSECLLSTSPSTSPRTQSGFNSNAYLVHVPPLVHKRVSHDMAILQNDQLNLSKFESFSDFSSFFDQKQLNEIWIETLDLVRNEL